LAKTLIESKQGKLLNTIEVNPKKAIMVVTLHPRKVLNEPIKKSKENPKKQVGRVNKEKSEETMGKK